MNSDRRQVRYVANSLAISSFEPWTSAAEPRERRILECGTTTLRGIHCAFENQATARTTSTNQATRGLEYPSIWLRIEALLEMSVRDWLRGTRETEYRSDKT
jgi:hypothetical protein